MTTFEVQIDPKDTAGAVAIDRINQALLKALSERMKTDKVTRSDIALKLGVDRSVVSNCFRGNQNIPARTMGEILWAMEYDFDIVLHDVVEGPGAQENVGVTFVQSSIEPGESVFRPPNSPPPKGSRCGTPFLRRFNYVIGSAA